MNFVVPDFYPAAAEIFVAVMALVIMLAFTFFRSIARSLAYFLTQATLVGAAFITIWTLDGQVTLTFNNMFISDLLGDLLKLTIYFSVAVGLLYGRGYLSDRNMDRPEYFLLALLMTLGMMVMVTANHMLSLYMGLEMMSLSLYVAVAVCDGGFRPRFGAFDRGGDEVLRARGARVRIAALWHVDDLWRNRQHGFLEHRPERL